MLAPQLRRQVDELWKMFWSSGMTNPLTSIEQITYLLFLKRLEGFDAERFKKTGRSIYDSRRNCTLPHHPDDEQGDVKPNFEGIEINYCAGHEACRWSYIQRGTSATTEGGRLITPHIHLSEFVFPWLRILDQILRETGDLADVSTAAVNAPLSDAYFQLPPEKTTTLQRAIGMVDRLFRSVGTQSGNADIMGDTFEYLLEEIQTSGKNGQFRTPRHIIRFMIDLMDPQPGDRIVDPAAGTAGFLINSIQHLMVKATPSENLVYEWDGTPHNAAGGDPLVEQYLSREYFTGYDNDRTMVRIGWMNMLLHGIENPTMQLSDTLGKTYSIKEAFDLVLANPPFTGTVDTSDLNQDRFHRLGVSTNKSEFKSELLFVWMALDLLKIGGRAAIIVPDGVLFGSTGAHRELRRRLLHEHKILGVISLPAGVFQPYTGVKTSILFFQKVGETPEVGAPPRTQEVWFYEVEADGRSLDAKRTKRSLPNDLWDANKKWPTRDTSLDFFQPTMFAARWRTVDEDTLKIFPEQITNKDQTLGIDELFGLPQNPKAATEKVMEEQRPKIAELYRYYYWLTRAAQPRILDVDDPDVLASDFDKRVAALNTLFSNATRQFLDNDFDRFGRNALVAVQAEARDIARAEVVARITPNPPALNNTTAAEYEQPVETIVKEFAKLDGYNVELKTSAAMRQLKPLAAAKSWSVPVRVWALNSQWTGPEGITGSHDEAGEVRPEYLADPELYDKDGFIKSEFLEPMCIEANDFNLTAGRYKSAVITVHNELNLAALIGEIRKKEVKIIAGLDSLLALVKGE